MKFNLILAGLLVAYATSPSNALPTKKGLVKNPLIVKLKKGVPQDRFRSILGKNFAETNILKYSYRPSFFNGFAGVFTNDFMHAVAEEYGNDIEYIEFDTLVHAFGSQPSPPSWGLTRTSQRTENLSEPYTYPDHQGKGIRVYVVDTGVQFDQADFGKRATLDASFVSGESAPDGNGHGTHCAGTVGSATYGIAKDVTILGVKVLNGQGSGQLSDVVRGMEHVASKANPNKVEVVMSMSLGGPKTQSLDDAANAAYAKNVAVIVAGGNDNKDACGVSPAGAKNAFTVGALDKNNKKASFSNFGSCTEIWAPGVGITSLWKGASGATNTISGTSMATPHVAGVAALYLAEKNYSKVQDLYDDLISSSTKGLITGLDKASPNRILYNKIEPMTDPNPPPAPGPGPTPPPPPPSDCPIPMPPGFPCPFPPAPSPGPGEPGECPIPMPPGYPCPFPTNPAKFSEL